MSGTYNRLQVLFRIKNSSLDIPLPPVNENAADGVCILPMRANKPSVFFFKNLRPCRMYKVVISGVTGGVESRFRTVDPDGFTFDQHEVRLAVVSNNNIFAQSPLVPDVWESLYKEIEKGSLSYCLHVGNQVYSDPDKLYKRFPGAIRKGTNGKKMDKDISSHVYERARSVVYSYLGFTSANDALTKEYTLDFADKDLELGEKVKSIFREVYRQTWSHPATAKCLARIPNLMICDEFDVVIKWPEQSKINYFIQRAARMVYYEYQRSLMFSVDKKVDSVSYDESIGAEHHFWAFGDVGIMFLDQRTTKAWNKYERDGFVEAKTLYGSYQWQEITKALADDAGRPGVFAKCKHLTVISPEPLVYFGQGAKTVLGPIEQDFQSHCGSGDNEQEQLRLLAELGAWRERGDAEEERREITLVSGHMNEGCHTDIFLGDLFAFKQVITSPICNHAMDYKSIVRSARKPGEHEYLSDDWSFLHHNFTAQRNFLILQLNRPAMSAKQRPIVEATLHNYKSAGITDLSFQKNENMSFDSLKSCSCSIM